MRFFRTSWADNIADTESFFFGALRSSLGVTVVLVTDADFKSTLGLAGSN